MWISPKTVSIFLKNFLNVCFDAIEDQSIINLSRYGSKSYASVVLDDSEVNIAVPVSLWPSPVSEFFVSVSLSHLQPISGASWVV